MSIRIQPRSLRPASSPGTDTPAAAASPVAPRPADARLQALPSRTSLASKGLAPRGRAPGAGLGTPAPLAAIDEAPEHAPAPAKEPEPRMTPEGLAGTVPRRSRDRLLPEELPHAGYLLARAAVGRKITGDERKRLRRADMSVRETRALMPAGRGNVREDIRDSLAEATRRSMGGRSLAEDPEVESDALSRPIWAGAGHCGEHGNLAAAAHAARLRPGEQSQAISGVGIDHAWAETTPADPEGKADEKERTIVMDAWADGPAVFASDSRYKSHQGGGTVKNRHGPEHAGLLQKAKELAAGIAGQCDPREMPSVALHEKSLWDAVSGVDEAFAGRVERAMDKEVSFRRAAAKGYKGLKTKARDALASMNPFGGHRKSAGPAAGLRRAPDQPVVPARWVKSGQGWVEQAPLGELLARERRQEAQADREHAPATRRDQPSKTEVAQAEERAGSLPATVRNEIMGAAVARELAKKMPLAEAARKAPEVVAAARGLLDPTPRVADWVLPASLADAALQPQDASAATKQPPPAASRAD
ncbi:hypothetical protein QF000_007918 [Paraburkholderia atlantica]|uniref:hypothetical protein n=1 Tax=Paraburkholderia atlantica TaxID=2654982 RepID=UPI003D1DD217